MTWLKDGLKKFLFVSTNQGQRMLPELEKIISTSYYGGAARVLEVLSEPGLTPQQVTIRAMELKVESSGYLLGLMKANEKK